MSIFKQGSGCVAFALLVAWGAVLLAGAVQAQSGPTPYRRLAYSQPVDVRSAVRGLPVPVLAHASAALAQSARRHGLRVPSGTRGIGGPAGPILRAVVTGVSRRAGRVFATVTVQAYDPRTHRVAAVRGIGSAAFRSPNAHSRGIGEDVLIQLEAIVNAAVSSAIENGMSGLVGGPTGPPAPAPVPDAGLGGAFGNPIAGGDASGSAQMGVPNDGGTPVYSDATPPMLGGPQDPAAVDNNGTYGGPAAPQTGSDNSNSRLTMLLLKLLLLDAVKQKH